MKDTIFFIISEKKKVNSILAAIHALGLSGGTVVHAEGIAPEGFLSRLGLVKRDKEMIMLAFPRSREEDIINILRDKYHFDEKNTGIGFSMPLLSYNGQYNDNIAPSDLYCLFVIIEKGQRTQATKALYQAGQRGASILNGRGAGLPTSYAFDFVIEEEKNILLMVVNAKDKERVMKEVGEELDIEKKGAGFMFSVPVLSTVGINKEKEDLDGSD